jgi:hypothetical protein
MGRVNIKSPKALRAELSDSDTCRCAALDLTVRSSSPVIKLCRELVARGIDPTTPLQVYRGPTLALRVRSIGEAARLKVHGASFELDEAVTAPPEPTGSPKRPPPSPTPSRATRAMPGLRGAR